MASKKYNFKIPLLDIDGTKIIEGGKDVVIISELLANHFRNAVMGKEITLKFFGWAVDLKTSGELTLDDEDRTKFRDNILDSQLPNISKGRICEILDQSK